jgi:dipeptidyl aminopeptidase/acylaminoacyl peptidase
MMGARTNEESTMSDAASRPSRPLFAFLFVTLLTGTALAQAPAKRAAADGLPPLIDRELFFGNPEISGANLSPDGKYISFLKPWKDTRNLWVKKVEEPYDAAKLVTADPKRPIPGYFWSRDSRYILFVQDKDGDENYNVHAVNPADLPAPGAEVPPARNVTDAKGARAFIYARPIGDPDVIYVGLNDRDPAWHDLYRVKISSGERTLLRKNTDKIANWVFDREGKLRLALRTADNGDTEILRVDDQAFVKVYSCTVFEGCDPLAFHKDGARVYMRTNKGDRNLSELTLFDPATGQEEFVERDPLKRVDLSGAFFSDRTGDLLATQYVDDGTRWYFKDKTFESDYEWIRKQLPGMEIGVAGGTADERRWMIVASGDREPGARYLFDRDKKTLTRQYRAFEKLPREALAARKPIRFKSGDGLEVPGYLTLPKGVPEKNLPLLVVPHGGPWARDAWGYDSMAQFFANRGYAVLQPNFRGSTGYGKQFLNAGNLQWGEKMQEDLTAGVKHLVAGGVADPKRVGILGGSYGGYATLAGVAFTPDLYAAAVSIVGPSNLLTLLESIPPYWEAGRKMFHMRMGDPTTPEGKKQLERQSPLNSAAKIRTPLMVVQGANDPRVKKAESDQIVIALRERGFPVEYLVAPDEGHGFARPVNNMAMFAAIEKFLTKHLGGRHQTEMPPAVSTRLGEITVDPKTVTLAKKVDTAAVGAPKVERQPEARMAAYQGKLEMGGQSMPVSSTTSVKQEADGWVVTESVQLMGQSISDTVLVESGTLLPKKRSLAQGPAKAEVTYSGSKVTGSLAMGGDPKPFDLDSGGPLFAEGASAQVALGALPLAEGYSVTFRTFDLMRQKVTLRQLAVLGIEEVTVPAGTFKAFKVLVKSAEGDPGEQTLWIATDKRQLVKVSATLPNGATMTAEMVK